MSTYREVLRLQNLIIAEGPVAKRRAASLELQNLLTRDETQARLAAEASSNRSTSTSQDGTMTAVRVSRWHALSLMWRGVMGSVVASVDATFSKRSVKLSRADLTFFHRMVVTCSTSSIGFENAYSIAKLGRDEVKAVLGLLLRLLDDDAAVELDELLLLQTLAFVCGQAEYVTHLRPNKIRVVMESIERRLTRGLNREVEDGSSGGIGDRRGGDHVSLMAREAAALAFDNLCRTVTQQAITVDPILPGTILLISTLCQQALNNNDGADNSDGRAPGGMSSSSRRLVGESNLLSGLVSLVLANPEQALAPLTRHGRTIFSYAKSRYANMSTETQRHSYHGLFLAWIRVSHVAGRLQGLVPGDVGDMGKATLNYRQISTLLELVMAENLKPTDPIGALGGAGAARPVGEDGLRLDVRQRTRLDLTARLFALAQRMYLTKAEWGRLKRETRASKENQRKQTNDVDAVAVAEEDDGDDNDDSNSRSDSMVDIVALLRVSERLSEPYLELPASRLRSRSCTDDGVDRLEIIGQSPFYLHVLRPLLASIPLESTHEYQSPWLRWAVGAASSSSTDGGSAKLPARSKTVQHLQVLCAVAEIFPVGVCWSTSCSETAWATLRDSSRFGCGSLDVLMGSPDDLAAVVELVATALLSCGGSTGDPSTQFWSLLCLRYLTQSTAVLSHFSRRNGNPSQDSMDSLQAPWREVWTTLFRPDLRYRAHTKPSSASSIHGYLVISLLESIIRCSCTDPVCAWEPSLQARQSTFLYTHQDEVWKLPCFADPRALTVRTTAPCFALLYAVLFHVGLSDGGTDVIGSTFRPDEEQHSMNQTLMEQNSRRDRLLTFCLYAVETCAKDESALRVVSACFVSLTTGMGRDASTAGYVDDEEFNVSLNLVSCSGSSYFPNLVEQQPEEHRLLWNIPGALVPNESHRVSLRDSVRDDVPTLIQSLLASELRTAQQTMVGADFVSAPQSSALISRSFQFLSCLLPANQSPGREAELTSPVAQMDLITQLKILKLVLSLESCQPGLDELSDFPRHFTHACGQICKVLTCDSASDDEVTAVLLNTCQIARSLLEGFARGSFLLPSSVGDSLEPLFPILRSLLDAYATGMDSSASQPSRPSRRVVSMDDDEDSDSSDVKELESREPKRYSDFGAADPRKRKVQESLRERGRSKAAKVKVPVPCQRAAILVSLLLATLQPDYDVCKQVAASLLGIDVVASDRNDFAGDINGGIAACFILVSQSVVTRRISHATGSRQQEALFFSLIARLSIATCQSTLDPFLASFRFRCCAQLVENAERQAKETFVNEEEADVILDLLGGDPVDAFGKYVEIRPLIRALQLRAATLVFGFGGESLHRRMDKEFPRRFVLPSLVDVDGRVRRYAAYAVAEAMRLLPEDKVIASVLKRLPSIDEYEQWYTSLASEYSHQLWEDARLSVECSVLNCWCTLLGAAESESSKGGSQILYDVVQVAVSRVDLENSCLQHLRVASMTLGYKTVELYLAARVDDLLRLWIKFSEISLLELPLLISAPALHLRTVLSGIDQSAFDPLVARPVAAGEFIAGSIGNLSVLLLINVASRLIDDSVTKEGRRLLFENRFMRDLTSVFTDHYNDDVVKDVLSLAVPNVIACKTVLSAGNDVEQRQASQIEALLIAALTEDVVQARLKRKAPATIRRFLDLSLRRNDCDEAAVESLVALVSLIGGEVPDANADFFAGIHATTAEFLVYTRYLISKAVTPSDKKRSVTSMVLMFHLISHQRCGARFSIGFAFETAAALLLIEAYRALHAPVAEAAERLFRRALLLCQESNELKAQVKHGCKALLTACMSSHESCQKAFYDLCASSTQAAQRDRNRGAGLLRSSIAENLWDWDLTSRRAANSVVAVVPTLSEYRDHVPRDIVDCLIATFNLIRAVLDGAETIGLEHHDIVGASPPYETPAEIQKLLKRLNSSFCAQSLLEEETHAPALRSRVPLLLLPIIGRSHARQDNSTLRWDERVLRAELTESTSYLRQRRMQFDDLDEDATLNLLRWLANVCRSHVSLDTRSDATYLIGELWSLLAEAGKGTVPTTVAMIDEDSATHGSSLEVLLQARIISAITVSTKHSTPAHALTAIDTLKSLMAVPEMAICGRLLKNLDEQRVVKTFYAATRTSTAATGRLTKRERGLLREQAELFSRCKLDDCEEDWCWSESLWKAAADASTSFDEWICCLVPGILVTAYSGKGGKGLFDVCQRLTSIDSSFASAVFPAALLQILQPQALDTAKDCCQSDKGEDGLLQTKLNERISCCFRALFDAYIALEDSRAIGPCSALELLVETLSFFCQFTSRHFTETTLRGNRPVPSNKATESADSTNSQPVDTRRSLPFGTILSLSGIVVAEACILAGRPASAIFFLEMYGEARFGRSTRAAELLGSLSTSDTVVDRTTTSDISGLPFNPTELAPAITSEECTRYLDALCRCTENLGDFDTTKAVTELKHETLAFQNSDKPLRIEGRIASLRALQHLNNEQVSVSFESPQVAVKTAISLEDLHLQSAARTYIAGIFAHESPLRHMRAIEKHQVREAWFRCALNRLRWDDSVFHLERMAPPGSLSGVQPGFCELVAESLFSFSQDDYELCLARIRNARTLLVNEVSALSSPEANLLGRTESLERLASLNDLEIIALSAGSAEVTLETYASRSTEGDINNRLSNEFSQTVSEISLRVVGSKLTRQGNSHDALAVRGALISQLWGVCSLACANGTHATAIGALDRLRSLHLLENDRNTLLMPAVKLQLQEAVIIESQGDFSGAIRRLNHLAEQIEREKPSLIRDDLLGEALLTSGRWMSKYKALPARAVLEKYMKPGASWVVSVHERAQDSRSALRATEGLLELAQLSSSLYDIVTERVESREWQRAGRILTDREAELQSCKSLVVSLHKSLSKLKKNSKEMAGLAKKLNDTSIYCTQLERQVVNAKCERAKVEASIHEYRLLTVQSITTALSIADTRCSHDCSHYVYRMISLWFSASKADESLDDAVRIAVEKVPSFHFVPLASQLFSRLGQRSKALNSQILQSLLCRICLDHPFHCLIQLLCLSNGMMVGEGVGGRGKSDYLENARSSKIDLARDLIKRLKESNAAPSALLESYELITDAYIYLALNQVGDVPRGSLLPFTKIGRTPSQRLDQCLSKLSRQIAPCILTKPPPIRPKCDYADSGGEIIGTERVAGFESTFSIAATGLSRPKIVTCIGSRGSRYKQLVKGHDEIRQDAVMEQVFSYVNVLLRRRRGTRDGALASASTENRNYRVVTYNIVPLSPAAGILEWVEHTVPFSQAIVDGDIRVKKTSLHARYCPDDWIHQKCGNVMKNAKPEDKRSTFDDVCRHFSPCFRYFFVEKFGHSMQAWYVAKQQYCLSVAVSSIVGHVLGIGDRHGANILVHERTGEVVHIDFGIVFEQGKLLTVPELVPFRLTQNVVDGLGMTGTDGLFTAASEAILTVLRQNSGALLTILSAVVSDPLYSWSMSPVKARERQVLSSKSDDDSNGAADDRRRVDVGKEPGLDVAEADLGTDDDQNEAAAAAVSKIKEKLQGYEDGTSGEQQSVQSQVQLLINSARDPDKLCAMFHGWSPWV